jgi:hypothetical protein
MRLCVQKNRWLKWQITVCWANKRKDKQYRHARLPFARPVSSATTVCIRLRSSMAAKSNEEWWAIWQTQRNVRNCVVGIVKFGTFTPTAVVSVRKFHSTISFCDSFSKWGQHFVLYWYVLKLGNWFLFLWQLYRQMNSCVAHYSDSHSVHATNTTFLNVQTFSRSMSDYYDQELKRAYDFYFSVLACNCCH